MVRRDEEGFFFVMDRKKNMFISGGENVYPAEVEAAPGPIRAVREVAVIGVADDRWGEVGHAFCVLTGGSPLDLEGLREFCDGKLARYKIPRHLTVVSEIAAECRGQGRPDCTP